MLIWYKLVDVEVTKAWSGVSRHHLLDNTSWGVIKHPILTESLIHITIKLELQSIAGSLLTLNHNDIVYHKWFVTGTKIYRLSHAHKNSTIDLSNKLWQKQKTNKQKTTTTTKIVIYNERQYKAPVLLASIEMMVMTIGSKQWTPTEPSVIVLLTPPES